MSEKDFAKIIREMKQWMPESSRALLAKKILDLLAMSIKEVNPDAFAKWIEAGGPTQFNKECELLSGLPHVKPDMSIQDSDLAKFCNRWMNFETYRDPNEGGEPKPVTADMHSIRFTMVNELKELADAERERNRLGTDASETIDASGDSGGTEAEETEAEETEAEETEAEG